MGWGFGGEGAADQRIEGTPAPPTPEPSAHPLPLTAPPRLAGPGAAVGFHDRAQGLEVARALGHTAIAALAVAVVVAEREFVEGNCGRAEAGWAV